MAYVKQTWSCGDEISAEKLNHMEDGIESANSGGGTEPLIVGRTESNSNIYLDKTFNEILEAINAGRQVFISYSFDDGEGNTGYYNHLVTYISCITGNYVEGHISTTTEDNDYIVNSSLDDYPRYTG